MSAWDADPRRDTLARDIRVVSLSGSPSNEHGSARYSTPQVS
jgi:hypothetical protein